MSASNRAKLIAKLHTALKKHYDVAPAQPARPLLEHVLYASLLEDCPADLADEGLAKCEQDFFDWNEVRVTTVTELAQVLSRLPEPAKAAARLKGNLQAIFEEFYTFDLDHLKKDNLGKAVSKFSKMPGMTSFVLNYTVQHGLGGHAVPIDYGAMVIMVVTGVVSQSEAAAGKVPGLERAIPKNKGIEFSALLHQAASALKADPSDKTGRALLDSVVKGGAKGLDEWLSKKEQSKKRAAKRRADEKVAAKQAAEAADQAAREAAEAIAAKKAAAAAKKAAATRKASELSAAEQATLTAEKAARAAAKSSKKKSPAKADAKTTAAEKSKTKPEKKADSKKAPAKKAADKKSPAKKTAAKKPTSKKTPTKKTPTKKSPTKKSPAKKSPAKKTPAKKTPAKKTPTTKATAKKKSEKKSASKKTPAKKAAAKPAAKKATNRKLTKRKPK